MSARTTSRTRDAALEHAAVGRLRQTVGVMPGDMLLTAAADGWWPHCRRWSPCSANEPDAAAHDRHREWQVLNGALTELLAGDAAAVMRSLILLEVIERASGGETEPDVAFELLRVNGERATTLRPGRPRAAGGELPAGRPAGGALRRLLQALVAGQRLAVGPAGGRGPHRRRDRRSRPG